MSGSSGLLDDVGELLELSLGSEEGTELQWRSREVEGRSFEVRSEEGKARVRWGLGASGIG